MNFIISANTDVGLVKGANQDSLSVKTICTPQGKMVFAILCDGMGGLSKGEVASAAVVLAFDRWVGEMLPELCRGPIEDRVIREHWETIVTEQNERINLYGTAHGVQLGTTVAAVLLTQSRYYILNVGDSRVYEIGSRIRQLTRDQSLVAREVERGNLTEEEAERDPRRSILLQCVGASEKVYPELFFGDVQQDAVYMLCSDGFCHEISRTELYENLQPDLLLSDEDMDRRSIDLIELCKQRQERDNISVVLIRTF